VEAARAALAATIAEPLHMTLAEAAAGIRRIVDMRMADEVRVFAARRGVDLSEFALLPFGGAGAVHAAAVAAELGMRRIIVPARPGAFSALGLLCTDVLHDYIRSELGGLDRLDPTHAEAMFRELEAKAAGELAAEGLDPSAAVFERDLDMRYAGQGYELRVPLGGLWQQRLDADALTAVRLRFDEVHEKIHGHAANEKAVEVVSYRLRVRVAVPKYHPQALPDRTPSPPPRDAIKGTRRVFFDAGRAIDTTIYDRDRLDVGASFPGPAIVEQFDATTVVPTGWHATVDRHGNLILEWAQ
jgi:N-methylhydantoinase A